ncbi:MAG: putative Fe-S cluster assembly protein SufT [Verrucomicrobiales bacterium]|jgi:probable FeS assembly SUF system protein SufT|nr:putative Fe-S cluster assembly protein SufT [Verrucomicrobiales bacterium]
MSDAIKLTREVTATRIPSGEQFFIPAGTEVQIIQSLGDTYTIASALGLARLEGKDADALGRQVTVSAAPAAAGDAPPPPADVERQIWEKLKTVYDPEIPVNIVDLGLVYDLILENGKAGVKMTLTAPGCGMGPVLQQEAQRKILDIPGVTETEVFLVWDPPWHQGMISEAGRMKLGMV